MTMVPAAQNLSPKNQQHQIYSGYGGCGANYYNNTAAEEISFGNHLQLMSQVEEGAAGYEHNNYNNNNISDQYSCLLGSDLVLVGPPPFMAEDESRTNSLNEEEAAASSSKDINISREVERDERWLQLGLGCHHETNNNSNNHHQVADQTTSSSSAARRGTTNSGLIELDLLPATGHQYHGGINIDISSTRPTTTSWSMSPIFHVPPHPNYNSRLAFNSNFASTTTSLYFQQQGNSGSSSSSLYPPPPPPPPYQQQQQQQQQQQEGFVNWAAFRPLPLNIGTTASTSSPSSYFARPFHHQQLLHTTTSNPGLHHHQYHHDVAVAGPSFDFRVVDPPRRPHSGIWFMLQASQNQVKEPFLPQIPKSYLRIKDGRMTVRLIKKYLVNKLRLDCESEVEITCRGQELEPFLTLQHVRDNIWSLRDAVTTLLPDTSTTTDHVMVLHYARTTSTITITTA